MWLNKLGKRLKVAEASWGLGKLRSPSEPCVEKGRRTRKEEVEGRSGRNYVPSGKTQGKKLYWGALSCSQFEHPS
jgi:hypothetical protein